MNVKNKSFVIPDIGGAQSQAINYKMRSHSTMNQPVAEFKVKSPFVKNNLFGSAVSPSSQAVHQKASVKEV